MGEYIHINNLQTMIDRAHYFDDRINHNLGVLIGESTDWDHLKHLNNSDFQSAQPVSGVRYNPVSRENHHPKMPILAAIGVVVSLAFFGIYQINQLRKKHQAKDHIKFLNDNIESYEGLCNQYIKPVYGQKYVDLQVRQIELAKKILHIVGPEVKQGLYLRVTTLVSGTLGFIGLFFNIKPLKIIGFGASLITSLFMIVLYGEAYFKKGRYIYQLRNLREQAFKIKEETHLNQSAKILISASSISHKQERKVEGDDDLLSGWVSVEDMGKERQPTP